MKTIFCALALCLLFASCKNNESKSSQETTAISLPANVDYNKMEGAYVGDFGGTGDIRIVLKHVTGAHAVGYDLHKGLRRNISGKMAGENGHYVFDLQEPGDNPYDGVFHFTIDPATYVLKGTWNPANNKNLTEKSFTLQKLKETLDTAKEAAYDPMEIMFDSTGEFHFEPNGLCIYRYYTDQNDTSATRQYEEIKGNWKKTSTEYIIDWQKNSIFPAQNHFRIMPYEEMDGTYYYLEGVGRKMQPQLAG